MLRYLMFDTHCLDLGNIWYSVHVRDIYSVDTYRYETLHIMYLIFDIQYSVFMKYSTAKSMYLILSTADSIDNYLIVLR